MTNPYVEDGAKCIGCGEDATTLWTDLGISNITCGSPVCRKCWDITNKVSVTAFTKAYEEVFSKAVAEHEERYGGRFPHTVADAIKVLSQHPGEMPFKVSGESRSTRVGLNDPMFHAEKIATIVGLSSRGTPIMGMTGDTYLIVE